MQFAHSALAHATASAQNYTWGHEGGSADAPPLRVHEQRAPRPGHAAPRGIVWTFRSPSP
jgi:hypothetical protein